MKTRFGGLFIEEEELNKTRWAEEEAGRSRRGRAGRQRNIYSALSSDGVLVTLRERSPGRLDYRQLVMIAC